MANTPQQNKSFFQEAKEAFNNCLRDDESTVAVTVPSRISSGVQSAIEFSYYRVAFWRPGRFIATHATGLAIATGAAMFTAAVSGVFNSNPLPASSPRHLQFANGVTRNTIRPALTLAGAAIDGGFRTQLVAGTDEDPGYTPEFIRLRQDGAGQTYIQLTGSPSSRQKGNMPSSTVTTRWASE